jgi:hypothetical protein
MNGNPAHTTGLAALLAAAVTGTLVYVVSLRGATIPPALVDTWSAVLTAGFGYWLHGLQSKEIDEKPSIPADEKLETGGEGISPAPAAPTP